MPMPKWRWPAPWAAPKPISAIIWARRQARRLQRPLRVRDDAAAQRKDLRRHRARFSIIDRDV
jgi:hypothetical protein